MQSSCECGNEPPGSINAEKLSRGFTTGGLSSSTQLQIVRWLVRWPGKNSRSLATH
jgi:hypothetical protein